MGFCGSTLLKIPPRRAGAQCPSPEPPQEAASLLAPRLRDGVARMAARQALHPAPAARPWAGARCAAGLRGRLSASLEIPARIPQEAPYPRVNVSQSPRLEQLAATPCFLS